MEGVIHWFEQFGPTDTRYLSAHYARYLSTRDFTLSAVPGNRRLRILDVGAHWLHNAFFYANRGHKLIVMDSPQTLEISRVKDAADRMGAEVRPNNRMEKADGFAGMTSDSIDIVLFCEVIEHLAFNPIPFWKQVYRVLKPGGHIIVTTPNAFYYRSLRQHIEGIEKGECIGLSSSKLFSVGTHGHHWKEFTLGELRNYFAYLSTDFDTSRYEMVYRPGEKEMSIVGKLEDAVSQKVDIRAYSIYLDVVLQTKSAGIKIKPPWEPP